MEFWSHSWMTPASHKVLALLMHYNGLRSALSGFVTAIVAGWLLTFLEIQYVQTADVFVEISSTLVLATVLCFWSPKADIFLDAACVPDGDALAKRNSIYNIGFFLKRSKHMLVLWDASYFTQLPCVFELAVRMKLKLSSQAALGDASVMPVGYGLMAVTMFGFLLSGRCIFLFVSLRTGTTDLASGSLVSAASTVAARLSVCFLATAAISLELQRCQVAVGNLHQQVEDFSTKEAQCFCCQNGHIHPLTRKRMDCDRLLIEPAITRWFGDSAALDAFVHGKLKERMPNMVVYPPYVYLVFSGVPVLYGNIARCWWHMKAADSDSAVKSAFDGLFQVFVLLPLVARIILTVFASVPGQPARGREGMRAARCTVVATLAVLPFLILVQWCTYMLRGEAAAYVAMSAFFGGYLALVHCQVPVWPDEVLTPEGQAPRTNSKTPYDDDGQSTISI